MKRLFLINSLALIFANIPAIASNHVILDTSSAAALFGSTWESQNAKDIWSYTFHNTTNSPQLVKINISSQGAICGNGPIVPCAGYNFACDGTTNDINAGSGTFCAVTIGPTSTSTITIANDGKTSGGIAQGQLQYTVKTTK